MGRHTWAWQATGAPLAHLRVLTQPHARGTQLTLFTDQGQAHGLLINAHDAALQAHTAGDTGSALGAGVLAPMPGRVLRLMAREGQAVQAGEPLLVLEAMKMEHTLCAPASTHVGTCHVQAGDQVSEGALLMTFASPPAAQSTP